MAWREEGRDAGPLTARLGRVDSGVAIGLAIVSLQSKKWEFWFK